MELQPRLVAVDVPSSPKGAVLVLHGGGSRRNRMGVSPTQLSVLRMVPVARRIARGGGGETAVYRLLNTYRGWDASHTPVDDVRWALGELAKEHGALPVCLVGHSLGGRAALLAGEHRGVVGVVALNAWTYGTERVRLPGRDVLFVHGDRDRIAAPDRALSVARALGRTAKVTFTTVKGGKHAMLRRGGTFEGLAVRFVRDVLQNGAGPPEPGFALERR